MAVTIAEVAHPNSGQTFFTFGPWNAHMVTVTLDSVYPTGGEVVTADQVGWNTIEFALIPNGGFANAAGTAFIPVYAEKSADGSQITLQAYKDAPAVGGLSLPEHAASADLSTFSGLVILVGS